MNADPHELDKFSALAERWWDPHSEFKPLHDINPLRLNYIDDLVCGLANKRVLDVGCGGGILSESMAARAAQVTGIDLSEKALSVARLHAERSGQPVQYRLISAEDLALAEPNSFDLVTCMEMLEHVPDPAQTVSACAQLLKPGGHVVFSTINRNLKAFLFAIIGAEYLLNLLPKGTHEYAKFITPAELARYARYAGLVEQAIIGITYHPLRMTYSLDNDSSVNYMMALRRIA